MMLTERTIDYAKRAKKRETTLRKQRVLLTRDGVKAKGSYLGRYAGLLPLRGSRTISKAEARRLQCSLLRADHRLRSRVPMICAGKGCAFLGACILHNSGVDTTVFAGTLCPVESYLTRELKRELLAELKVITPDIVRVIDRFVGHDIRERRASIVLSMDGDITATVPVFLPSGATVNRQVIHPAGKAILAMIDKKLGLMKKLEVHRRWEEPTLQGA